MARVLSIEIGKYLIHICEMDYNSKNPKVYKWATIETPAGTLTDDVLNVSPSLVETIALVKRQKKMEAKKLVFSLNSTKIATREATIPFVKENRVRDLVVANASDYFPVDLEQFELAHNILEVIEDEKGGKQYRVQVYAVPKYLTEGYRELARAMGTTIESMDYSGNSIQQALKKHFTKGVHMVVDMSVAYSMITVMQGNTVVMQRSIAHGLESAMHTIKDSHPQFSYLQCVGMLRERNYFQNERPTGEEQRIRESFRSVINGILRVVDYYNSHYGEEAIDQVHLTGEGATCPGIADYLGMALGVDVEILEDLENWKLKKFFKHENFGPYLVCIGAVINPIGIAATGKDKSVKMDIMPKDNNFMALSALVLVGGIAVAVALAFVSDNAIKNAENENQRLTARRDSLLSIEQVYQEYLQQQYTTDKLNYYYDSTVLPNEKLVEFIEEMEEKLPSTLNIQSFSSNESGVTMAITVADKKAAAKLIQQLRGFESVAEVEISAIADAGAVMDGEPMEEEANVSFTISATYMGKEQVQEGE